MLLRRCCKPEKLVMCGQCPSPLWTRGYLGVNSETFQSGDSSAVPGLSPNAQKSRDH